MRPARALRLAELAELHQQATLPIVVALVMAVAMFLGVVLAPAVGLWVYAVGVAYTVGMGAPIAWAWARVAWALTCGDLEPVADLLESAQE